MWVKRGRRIFAHSFQPAASPKALTHISREIRKAAEERAPTAELITKARRFMDVSFSLDMFATFKIFRMTAKAAGTFV